MIIRTYFVGVRIPMMITPAYFLGIPMMIILAVGAVVFCIFGFFCVKVIRAKVVFELRFFVVFSMLFLRIWRTCEIFQFFCQTHLYSENTLKEKKSIFFSMPTAKFVWSKIEFINDVMIMYICIVDK